MGKKKKSNEEVFFSKRRRDYHFGIMNPELHYSQTMGNFCHIVCEKTLGFSKESDEISLSQFQEILGLSERQLRRLGKRAIECQLIKTQGGIGRGNLVKYFSQEDKSKWLPDIKSVAARIASKKSSNKKEKRTSEVSIFKKRTSRMSSFKKKGTSRDQKEDILNDKSGRFEAKKRTSRTPPTAFTANTAITHTESTKIFGKFLNSLKQYKQYKSLPNYKEVESLSKSWNNLFQDKRKESYPFRFPEDLKLIIDLLKRDSLKYLQEEMEEFPKAIKKHNLPFSIQGFSDWIRPKKIENTEDEGEDKEGDDTKNDEEVKSNRYKLSEENKKKLSLIKELEDDKVDKKKLIELIGDFEEDLEEEEDKKKLLKMKKELDKIKKSEDTVWNKKEKLMILRRHFYGKDENEENEDFEDESD